MLIMAIYNLFYYNLEINKITLLCIFYMGLYFIISSIITLASVIYLKDQYICHKQSFIQ